MNLSKLLQVAYLIFLVLAPLCFGSHVSNNVIIELLVEKLTIYRRSLLTVGNDFKDDSQFPEANYSSNSETSNSSNLETFNSSNLETSNSSNLETSNSSNLETSKTIESENENLIDYFSLVPDHVILLIHDFLDFSTSQCSLLSCSKTLTSILDSSIEKKLFNFCPCFVFNQKWMNRIMFHFLTKNFIGVENINDKDHIYDALELANFKMFKQNYGSLPPLIFSAFIRFMFEVVYGTDELFSCYSKKWINHFFKKLLKHKMPKCRENYLTNLSDEIPIEIRNFYIDFLNFLGSDNHTWEEINSFLDNAIDGLNEIYPLYNPGPEIKILFFQLSPLNFQLEILDEDDIFNILIANNSFSQSLFDLYTEDSVFLRKLLDDKYLQKEVKLIKALYKKIIVDDKDPLKYLWTRDVLHPFDMDVFIEFSSVNGVENVKKFVKRAILEISVAFDEEIIHLKIFGELIRSGIHDFNIIESAPESLLSQIFFKSSIFLDIFLTQIPTSYNFFILDEGKYRNLIEIRPFNILTFKQIVHSLEIQGLIDILAVYSANIDHIDLDTEINEYPAPISFYKYLHESIFEPADGISQKLETI